MKRRKIYYIPIMIILIGISILCVWYLNTQEKGEKSILIFTSGGKKEYYNKTCSTPFKTGVISLENYNRKYINYDLNGNESTDNKILNKFNIEMQRIIEHKDTINAQHVIFGDAVKYNTYIKALDICLKNCQKYSIENFFILYGDNLWFLYDNQAKKEKK